MRKALTLSLLLTLVSVSFALAADSPSAPPAAPADTTASAAPADDAAPAPAACGAVDLSKLPEAERNAWFKERGMQPFPSQSSIQYPPCPPVDGCGGVSFCTNQTPCEKASQTGSVDTGNSICTLPGGSLYSCPGSTIRALTYSCSKCPCCDLPPGQRCACPPSCPSGHSFECGGIE